MTETTETRSAPLDVNDAGLLSGYVALFDQPANIGGFDEVIRPGAFKRSIGMKDIPALWNHNNQYVLGRTGNGTLRLREDATGLFTEIDLPETTWAQDLRASIRRGDVPGASFQFVPVRNGERRSVQSNGRTLRELLEVKLLEVSVGVANPAYSKTEIQARSNDRPARPLLLRARLRILTM